MDELVELVAKRTGISEENARVAVNTVVNYLKDKLPGPAGAQLEALLKGGDVADLLGGLGGLLGKK